MIPFWHRIELVKVVGIHIHYEEPFFRGNVNHAHPRVTAQKKCIMPQGSCFSVELFRRRISASCIIISNEHPIREMSYKNASANCLWVHNRDCTPLKSEGRHHLYCEVSSAPEMGPPSSRVLSYGVKYIIREDALIRPPRPAAVRPIPMRALEHWCMSIWPDTWRQRTRVPRDHR